MQQLARGATSAASTCWLSGYTHTHRPFRRSARPQRRVRRAAASGDEGEIEEEVAPLGDWRAFRASLIAQTSSPQWSARVSEDNQRLLQVQDPSLAAEEVWAHSTPGAERGGLLLAAPDAHLVLPESERLWQAVVLLVDHSAAGSIGLVLNRPSGLVVGRKRPGGLPFDVAGAPPSMQDVFSDNRVYCGGFMAQQMLHVMHGHRQLEGAVEIVPGVFLGGEAAATDAVRTGALAPATFKFFSGALVWGPGQLQAEVDKGAWHTAAASRALVLKQVLQLPKPLWREIMELMGGEWALAARRAYEDEGF